jgi:hypothetical protein
MAILVSALTSLFALAAPVQCVRGRSVRAGIELHIWVRLHTHELEACRGRQWNDLRHEWIHDGASGPHRDDPHRAVAPIGTVVVRTAPALVLASMVHRRTVSTACCVLGGHLQISAYTLVLASVYIVGLGPATTDRWSGYLLRCVPVVVLGGALASVQLIPTIELSRLSVRAEMTLENFFSGSLPPFQTVQLLFPYLYGGARSRSMDCRISGSLAS